MALAACHLLETDSALPPEATPTSPPFTVEPTATDLIRIDVDLPAIAQTPDHSHRSRLTITFDGSWAGQPVQGTIETNTTISQNGDIHSLTQIETDHSTPPWQPGRYEFIKIGQQLYVKTPRITEWLITPENGETPADFGFFDGREFILLPTFASSPMSDEILDGRDTIRADFDGSGLTVPNIQIEAAQGAAWVSANQRYIAQYHLLAMLTIMLPDPTHHPIDRGLLKIRYQVTPADHDIKIEPPELPTTTRYETLPRLPEAQIVTTLPNFLEYTAPISPTGAAYFYRETLHELGWLETHAALFEEKAELHFSYNEDETVEQTARILITEVDGGLVKVVVYRQSE